MTLLFGIILMASILNFFDVDETVKLVLLVVIPVILYIDYRYIQHDKSLDSLFASGMMFLILECLFSNEKYPLILNADEARVYFICAGLSTLICGYFTYKYRDFFMGNLKAKYGSKLPTLKWFFLALTFAAVCAVTAFPIMANIQLANALLDRSAAQPRTVVVTELYKSTSNHGITTYSIYYPSWRNPADQEKVDVNRDFYYSKKKGDQVLLETKPGFFGLEWLVDYR